MAWNGKKMRFECDRCGKKISPSQTVQLCKECDMYLIEYFKKRKEQTDGLQK